MSKRIKFLLCGSLLLLAGASVVGANAAPFQTSVSSACSGTGGNCQFLAQAVPNNRRVKVTNVSCLIRVADGETIREAWIRNQSGTFDFFVPALMSSGPPRTYAFNAQTLFFAKPGDEISVGFAATGDITSSYCKLAGEIVQAS